MHNHAEISDLWHLLMNISHSFVRPKDTSHSYYYMYDLHEIVRFRVIQSLSG